MTTTTDTTIYGTSPALNSFGTTKTSTTSSSTSTTSSSSTTDEAKTAQAKTDLDQNYTQFLTLLTTQMKNQDPLNPMDTNQMTTQLVQFSAVEQAIGTNSRLDKLLKLQQSNSASSNLMYVGRAVEYEGDSFQYNDGMTAIELGYKFDGTAKSSDIKILDSNNNVVYEGKGETEGNKKHSFVWNFKDSEGNAVSTGQTYHISVTPTAETADTLVQTTTYTRGQVVNVEFGGDSDTILHVNGTTVPLSNVVSVG